MSVSTSAYRVGLYGFIIHIAYHIFEYHTFCYNISRYKGEGMFCIYSERSNLNVTENYRLFHM